MTEDMKEQLYYRLKKYLAIRKHGFPSDKLYKMWHKVPAHARGVTNVKTDKYYPVMWMPALKKGWRRLTLREFEGYYQGQL